MPSILQIGSQGPDVLALQQSLQEKGFSPGALDSHYGGGTQAAVLAFQRSEGLLADGVAGPRTLAALGEVDVPEAPSAIPGVTVAIVSQMFPVTPIGNIKANLPQVLDALVESTLNDQPMVLMALSTIRAETEGFEPIPEGKSIYNTSPNGHPFDLYDNRKDLGNRGAPDGASFRGRGFIQLTGRANYTKYGPIIGVGDELVSDPDIGCDPKIASKLLAAFLKNSERAIKEALLENDLRHARKLVNGGSNGLDRFTEAFNIGKRLLA
ncbi:MAG: peptidoglycan-binding protein [Candidatus Binataceae bacterium]|jgi:peptidoglycan L-alanyl-D-glutamate endopeptidase CwlK